MSLFYEAAEIVKQGSNTEIIYTDKVGFVGAMSEI